MDAKSLVFTPLSINQRREYCSSVNASACVKKGRTQSQKRLLIDKERRFMQLQL